MSVLSEIEPKEVFRFFEEISAIPRGSMDTKRISDYLVKFAKDRDLKVIQDEVNNVIIFQPGTEGYEDSEPVILQGHMELKGRIYGIMLVRTAIQLYFNQNIKYVIRRWKHK